ncbi:WHG domain-containing protein [Amnibacterium flavum]|uniref:TetR family transcriptional regulator n=1 Tax=Amnibacterium flavum TaxID=2173173 RepID=A0A2V1HUH5_9MICO|nr:TetR/AcrR family transcriptional regulator [Amnibacterium flavum]PVZ95342.1 TetR family transcriptional regulator [Amnibacterium flavum]
MPTPDRTSLDAIVDAATSILETDGLTGLTMQAVAQRVGVKAPSLYKRVTNREHLIALVAESALAELRSALREVPDTGGDVRDRLAALATAFRAFARQHPAAYRLVFAGAPDSSGLDPEALARAGEPVFEAVETLTGPDRGLDGARLVTAWAHGFISMELAGAFRMGGDVDEAFAFGIRTIAAALSSSAPID